MKSTKLNGIPFVRLSRMDEIIDSQIKAKEPEEKDPDKDIDESEKELNNTVVDYLKRRA